MFTACLQALICLLIAPTFQASEQLGVYGDSGFDSLECNIPDTKQWLCCMKPKKRAGSRQDAKRTESPRLSFSAGTGFLFCLVRCRRSGRSAAFSANCKRLVGVIPSRIRVL